MNKVKGLNISPEIHKELKMASANSGETVREIAEMAILKEIKTRKKQKGK